MENNEETVVASIIILNTCDRMLYA